MARGDLWDSAEVRSEKSFDIEYGSMPPLPRASAAGGAARLDAECRKG